MVQMVDSGENKDAEKTQKVLSLNMRALKDFLRSVKGTENYNAPLHRVDELYAAANAHEQAQILDKRKTMSKEKNSQDDKGAPKKKLHKTG